MRSIVFVMGVICLICLSNSGSAQGLLGSIFGTSYDKTCESNAKRSLGPSTRGPIGKADVANDLSYTMYEIKDNLSLEHGNTFATVMAKEIFFTECHSSVRRLDVKMQLEKKCQWPCVRWTPIVRQPEPLVKV